MIAWLAGLSLFSLLASWLSNLIVDAVVRDVTTQTTAARNAIFVGTWTSVTTAMGMRSFRKTARGLRLKGLGVKDKIDALTKDERG